MTSPKKSPNTGRKLEQQTEALLRLFPGARVAGETEIKGKKVDLLCELPGRLRPDFRIAVECKDWKRPLSRKVTAQIVSEYLPLLDGSQIDQFLLVTNTGLVPNAKKLFDGRRTQHLTFAELADQLFDPGPLVENMVRQFESDGFSDYYIKQRGFAPSLEIATKYYHLLYNDFLDFAIEMKIHNFKHARQLWNENTENESDDLTAQYTSDLFELCLEGRNLVNAVDLESFVLEWLDSREANFGLALLGTYGTGKSSFARRIAYTCAKRYRKDALSRIPFLIELKEFGSHQDVRGLVTHELVNRHGVANGSFELFQSLNSAGRFVVILDGFDEMKEGMTSDSVIYNFNQLGMLCTAKSKVLLCGRPTAFESHAEQNRILTGQPYLHSLSQPRYMQVQIAPFQHKEVSQFFRQYAKVKAPDTLSQIEAFVKDLEAECEKSSSDELRSLVTRPVHLPMLAAVIPRKGFRASELKRSSLYDEFIDAIIERELLKRRPEFQQLYPSSARRNFARELAVEMYKRSEVRSIRMSEIPTFLLDPFVTHGRPHEAVRRDLVAACFLDRKPPDILFMPHMSFLEFLVADFIVLHVSGQTEPATDDLGVKLSDEVVSFLEEMLTGDQWLKISKNSTKNLFLIMKWLKSLRTAQKNLPTEIEQLWADTITEFPSKIREHLVLYVEERRKWGENRLHQLRSEIIEWIEKRLYQDFNELKFQSYEGLIVWIEKRLKQDIEKLRRQNFEIRKKRIEKQLKHAIEELKNQYIEKLKNQDIEELREWSRYRINQVLSLGYLIDKEIEETIVKLNLELHEMNNEELNEVYEKRLYQVLDEVRKRDFKKLKKQDFEEIRERILELEELLLKLDHSAQISTSAVTILENCLSDQSDVAAVHAYRVLTESGHQPSDDLLVTRVGYLRVKKWVEYNWIKPPKFFVKTRLIEVLKMWAAKQRASQISA